MHSSAASHVGYLTFFSMDTASFAHLTPENVVFFAGHLEAGIGVRQFIQPLISRTECASTASAWKCSRVLSGFLASTAHSSDGECPSWQNSRQSILTGIHPVGHHGGSDLWVDSIRTSRRRFTHVGHCGASEEQLAPSENITPVTLWEVRIFMNMCALCSET
jgi:hypothetical protein